MSKFYTADVPKISVNCRGILRSYLHARRPSESSSTFCETFDVVFAGLAVARLLLYEGITDLGGTMETKTLFKILRSTLLLELGAFTVLITYVVVNSF